MVDRVYPAAAVTGAPSYDGRALRQTAVAPFVAGATAARPLGARSGVRPGTPSSTVSATSTTWTVNAHAGVIDAESANEAGPYTYAFDAVKTGSMTAASASFARIDRISVQISDPAESDGSSTPSIAIVYTAGTAAAPALPTAPPRSFDIAQINVPISGGGAPSVTWVAPTSAAAGGITPATSSAFGSGAYVGQYIDDPTLGLLRWNGSAWTVAITTGAWTAYTPTIGGTASPTITYARYTQTGKTVTVQTLITLTAGATGVLTVSCPVTPRSGYPAAMSVGRAEANSGTTVYQAPVEISGSTLVARHSDTGLWDTTRPFSGWASGNTFAFSATYEAA